MALKVCAEPGCHVLCNTTRCHPHTRAKDKARGTKQQRGYDAAYDRERDGYMAALARGEVLTCWRCGDVVMPHEFSLGHCDDDRDTIHGPEHLTRCNLANTRGNCPHPMHNYA